MAFTALIALSFLLQVAGFASPGWIFMQFQDITIQMGLWYIVVCIDKCHLFTMDEYHSKFGYFGQGLNDTFLEYQAETTVALLFCIIAVLAKCGWRASSQPRTGYITASLISALVSGVLAIVAAGTLGRDQYNAQQLMAAAGSNLIKPPYSLILTGAGGVLACLAVFVATHALCTANRRPASYSQPLSMATYSR